MTTQPVDDPTVEIESVVDPERVEFAQPLKVGQTSHSVEVTLLHPEAQDEGTTGGRHFAIVVSSNAANAEGTRASVVLFRSSRERRGQGRGRRSQLRRSGALPPDEPGFVPRDNDASLGDGWIDCGQIFTVPVAILDPVVLRHGQAMKKTIAQMIAELRLVVSETDSRWSALLSRPSVFNTVKHRSQWDLLAVRCFAAKKGFSWRRLLPNHGARYHLSELTGSGWRSLCGLLGNRAVSPKKEGGYCGECQEKGLSEEIRPYIVVSNTNFNRGMAALGVDTVVLLPSIWGGLSPPADGIGRWKESPPTSNGISQCVLQVRV